MDKWLWSVRIFKSRSIASEACRSGQVYLDEDRIKQSHLLKEGDIIQVKKDGFNLTYRVIKLIEKRVGAPIAVTCYEDLTPDEELNKYKDWFIGKARPEFRERGTGRPTKKERREIDDFKDDQFD